MSKKILTDEEVEEEIKELLNDEDVRLAKAEERIRNKRRQYLYKLKGYKKRGQEMRNNPEYASFVEAFDSKEVKK